MWRQVQLTSTATRRQPKEVRAVATRWTGRLLAQPPRSSGKAFPRARIGTVAAAQNIQGGNWEATERKIPSFPIEYMREVEIRAGTLQKAIRPIAQRRARRGGDSPGMATHCRASPRSAGPAAAKGPDPAGNGVRRQVTRGSC